MQVVDLEQKSGAPVELRSYLCALLAGKKNDIKKGATAGSTVTLAFCPWRRLFSSISLL